MTGTGRQLGELLPGRLEVGTLEDGQVAVAVAPEAHHGGVTGNDEVNFDLLI